jgi:hypothetical protein
MTLDIDERTELLEGVIYEVSPRNEPYRYAVSRLGRALTLGLDARYIVRSQDAVAIAGWQGRDAPEVDVAVIRDEYYPTAPTAADAIALIEVSDTSYRLDRDYKIPLYVSAGVPSWIVCIPERRIEYYGAPSDLDAAHGITFLDGESIVVAGVRIDVSDLFPKRT